MKVSEEYFYKNFVLINGQHPELRDVDLNTLRICAELRSLPKGTIVLKSRRP